MPKLAQEYCRGAAVPFDGNKLATVSHPVMWNYIFTVLPNLKKKKCCKTCSNDERT